LVRSSGSWSWCTFHLCTSTLWPLTRFYLSSGLFVALIDATIIGSCLAAIPRERWHGLFYVRVWRGNVHTSANLDFSALAVFSVMLLSEDARS